MDSVYGDIIRFVANNLKCSICLEMFTNPVTLPCGHNYCLDCIKDHLGRNQNQTCPQCRHQLPKCPKLNKNVTICNLLDLHDAGGRKMWDEVLTDHEYRKESSSFTTDASEASLSSSSSWEGCSFSLDSNGTDNSSAEPQVGGESSLDGSSQMDEILGVSSHPEEVSENQLEGPDSFAAGCEGSSSSEFKAAALGGAFVPLSFLPQLRHRRLVFDPERRRIEVTFNSSLRTQICYFRVCQWMAEQEFTIGRHYWDVETSSCSGWATGVAYTSLARDEQLGRSQKSWCIEWSNGRFSAWHQNTETPLKQSCPSRVRVLLDMDVGHLSFWRVNDVEAELYSIQVEFREPVRPLFWLFGTKPGNSLSFPKP